MCPCSCALAQPGRPPMQMRAGGLKIAITLLAACTAAAGVGLTVSAFSSTTGNSGNSFATAASFSSCPNTTVTAGLTSGFESGRFPWASDGLFPQGSGLSIDGTVARTGGYSVRLSPAAAASNLVWFMIPAQATVVVRFALRMNTLPGANVAQLASMAAGGGATAELRYVSASQKLALAIKGATGGTPVVATASSTVTAGAWHLVEIRYAVGTTTHAADWQIDETTQPGVTVAGTATTSNQAYLGTLTTDTFTAYYDDVLISFNGAQYPHGDGRVYRLLPSGMGTHVGAASFQDDDGTALDAASWQRLDEIPTNSVTDYIQQVGSGGGNYAEVALADTTETCIRAAQGTVALHSASTNQNNAAKASVYDGATETILKSGTTTANTAASRDYTKLVVPTSSWSQAAVNGLVARVGYGTDVNPVPMWDGVGVEIEIPQ
jgi:hypothetical protein